MRRTTFDTIGTESFVDGQARLFGGGFAFSRNLHGASKAVSCYADARGLDEERLCRWTMRSSKRRMDQ